jgi:hypothetical protein
VKFAMVNDAVPTGTNSSTASSSPPGRRVCAGVQCSNPIPMKRGKNGPGGGYDRFCSECCIGLSQALPSKSQSTPNKQIPKKGEPLKRNLDQLTPDTSPLDPKKSRLSDPPHDFSEFSADLEKVSKRVLIDRINKLIEFSQTCIAEKNSAALALKDTEDAFNAYKIAFADEAFKAFTSRPDPITNSKIHDKPESSTLVVTVSEAASNEEVDTQTIDRLLESTLKGPVPQFVKRKEGKMYISFSDAVQSGRAKSLMESKPECVHLFESVVTQSRLFPVVALHVDISDLDSLKKELVFRNTNCGFAIKQVRTIFRSPNNQSGHVKLFFDSKRVRDEVLKSGRLFANGKRIQIVEVDLNREVRRCYRCQAYGHIAKTSNNACAKEEVCGYCSGPHSTRVCAHKGQPKCANCQKAHRSGDPSCHHQIRAVGRYRAAIEQ